MAAYGEKNYSGAAKDALTTADVAADGLSVVCDDLTGWPTSNFDVVLDPEGSSEEKREVETRSGNTLIFASTGLGYDDSAPQDHSSGTIVRHIFTARAAKEANDAVVNTIGRITAKGDLLAGTGANTLRKVAVGANGLPLQADSSATAGVAYGTLAQEVTHDDPDTDQDATSLHHTLGDGDTQAAPGDHDHSGSDGYTQTVPVGTIHPYLGATAPTGYLLCDGAAVSRTTYSALFALLGTTYGTGDGSTTFNLPNLKGRFLVGKDASQTEFDVLGETGGAKSKTLSTGELPSHTHSIDHDHGSFDTASTGAHDHDLDLQYATTPTTSGGGNRVTDINQATGGGGTHVTASTETDGAHVHAIDVPAFTGTSGSTGSGDAFSLLPPYMASNFIVKW